MCRNCSVRASTTAHQQHRATLTVGAGPTPPRASWIVCSGTKSTAAQAKNVVTEACR
jgi:hypothetical protein